MSRPLKRIAQPLYVLAKKAILGLIQEDSYPDNKLPSEAELSETLGISRTTIREALMALHREGVITKQHGIGNLIHPSTLNTRMQIDRFADFLSLLEDGGYRADVTRSRLCWMDSIPSEYQLGENIKTEDQESGRHIFLQSIFTADGRPAILSENFIRESVLRKNFKGFDSLEGMSFVEILNSFSTEDVVNSVIAFKPAAADSFVAEKLVLQQGVPIMQWCETTYSAFDSLICLSRISFHPELVNLTLLRKWK